MTTKILITGDYCPIGRNELAIQNGDYKSIFGDFSKYIDSVDYAVTNLECPITESDTKIVKTGPNLKSSLNSIKPLSFAGFNLATLANNHIMDYGSEGLESTLKSCSKEGISTVGAAKDLQEARKPFYINLNGKRFAFLNIAENEFCTATKNAAGANPLDLIKNHNDIKSAKSNSDYVILISHGGREHYQLPTPKQRERYRFFIDSGADAVIGHHTHCYSGYEYYKEKPIFYSLGNFIFDYKKKYQKGLWTQGMAVQLNFEKNKIGFELIPFNQGTIDYVGLKLLSQKEKNIFDEKIKQLNNIITNDDLFNNSWRNYLNTQKPLYKGLLLIQNKYIRALISRGFLPKLFFHSKQHKVLLLNLFKCETHHEIMTDVLYKKLDK